MCALKIVFFIKEMFYEMLAFSFPLVLKINSIEYEPDLDLRPNRFWFKGCRN